MGIRRAAAFAGLAVLVPAEKVPVAVSFRLADLSQERSRLPTFFCPQND